MRSQTLFGFAVLVLAIVCLAGPSSGSVLSTSRNFPPYEGRFESQSTWSALFSNGFVIADAGIKGFSQNLPPPPPGGSNTQYLTATVYGQMSVDGGATFLPFTGSSNIAVALQSDSDTAVTRNFTTELLQMDVSSNTPWGLAMLRESPLLHSTGQMSVTNMGGGTYSFDSFFDVYMELSVDLGNTWTPTLIAPDHQVLVPEPATLTLLALGAFAMIRRRR